MPTQEIRKDIIIKLGERATHHWKVATINLAAVGFLLFACLILVGILTSAYYKLNNTIEV